MRIIGTGSALPAYTLTNDRLAEFLDTSDEWIRTRTGIGSRQIMTDENLVQLGREAAFRALENACIGAEEIDFIICTTVQGDTITPSMACVLQNEIGAVCAAVDINGACAGFIYALDMADSMIKCGKARRVLIISAEGMSRLVDWEDRSTCVLFGDGAGAAVVDGGDGLFLARLTSEGDSAPLNILPDTGNSPFLKHCHPMRRLYMDGQEIYKFAVSHSSADLQAVIADTGNTLDRVDHYLLHQANKRIVDAVRTRLKQPAEKFPVNVNVRGNTSSASIPILLDEKNREGRFKKGDIIAMSAFGAGLTTAACIFEWTRE